MEKTNENQMDQVPTDPWLAAFEAINNKDKEDAEATSDTIGADGANVSDTTNDDENKDSTPAEEGDSPASEEVPGGPGDLGGTDSSEDEGLDWDGIDLSEDEVTQYKESLIEDIRERTINDVVKAYIDKGARHTDGKLGASINDPDVCKRDRDGVPRFYNPETGREFTGDNPRRQAQEWVDDYNKELANAFNKTCQDYSQQLLAQEGGRLAIIEFAPKYKALDPVRRAMFESIIEDYEVTDNSGNVISYSCDLDKALAAVNRQVDVIKKKFTNNQTAASVPESSGPALDTPSTSASHGEGKPQFKSIEEAMEWEQDQLLAKMKKGN